MKKPKKTTSTKTTDKSVQKFKAQVARLRVELADTKETLRAIQAGEVDALVVSGEGGRQVFTLQGAEHPYRVVIETMNEGTATLSNDGTVLYCNSRFAEILKTPMEKIVGQWVNRFMSDQQVDEFRRMLKKSRERTVRGELTLQAANGDEAPVLVSLAVLKDTVNGICMVVTDIADLKQAQKALKEANETLEQRVADRTAALQQTEEELRVNNEELLSSNDELRAMQEQVEKANSNLKREIEDRKKNQEELNQLTRTLRALSRSSQAMIRWQEDEKAYLDAVCKIIVKDCGHEMVWIGYAEDDKYKSVRPVAYSGFEEGYLEKMKISWADTERGRGPTGMAIRTGKVSNCPNILTDPKFEPWRKEALKRGYASSIVFPLKNVYKTFGALTIYSTQPDPFTKNEVKLLAELADDLAFGLTTVRLHAAEKEAQDALRESEERFRAAFLRGSIAMAMSSLDSRLMKVNPAFCQMLGFTEAELVNRRWIDLTHPDDVAANLAGVQRMISGQTSVFRMEKRYIRKDGSVIWADMSTAAVRDAQGKALYIVTHIQDITERKRAEEALHESEERFRAFFESAAVGTAEINLDGRFTQVNDRYCQITGYSREELLTMKAIDLSLPDERLNDQKLLAKYLKGSLPTYEIEKRYLRKDGRVIWVHVTAAVIRDAKGNPLRAAGIIQDISERKKAEESLQQSEEELRLITDTIPVMVWAARPDGVSDYYNRKFLEYLGKTASEMEGWEWANTIHPEDKLKAVEAWTKAFKDGSEYEIEYRIRRGCDGSYRWHLGRALPLRSREGRIVRWFGTCTDIDDSKQAEEKLRESEERFRMLSEAVPGVVWTAQPDGAGDYYNKRWYEYTGLPADAPESTWKQTIHPDDQEATFETWATSVRTGARYNVEHRIRRADGQYHWFLSRGIPLRDSEGKIVKWFGTTTDIEEQKQSQQALELLMGELEHKNEELESIIRIASHDLRSPLMNIKGFSGELAKDISKLDDVLKKVELPPEAGAKVQTVFGKYVPEAIGFIQTSADAINQMIKSLMQVAKAGTMPVHVLNLDMNAIFANISANAQFRLKEKGGRLEVEQLPGCRGDATQITQVFTNLVENAIKYRDPARPMLIKVYASAEPGKVTYCVEDNGKGIAEEHLDKVFDLFTRLHPESGKGEGIGLTIAKRMVERQGGRIWASSEVGKGSKFFVTLPR